MPDSLDATRAQILAQFLRSEEWKALREVLQEQADAYRAQMVTAAYRDHDDMLEANRTQAVYEWLTNFTAAPEALLTPTTEAAPTPTSPIVGPARRKYGPGRVRV